jgi:hypothetical protein
MGGRLLGHTNAPHHMRSTVRVKHRAQSALPAREKENDMRQITTSVRVPALLLACSALFTACGGGSEGSGAGGGTATAQTITFTNPGEQATGATVTLAATASSGFDVAYRSNTSSVCTVSGAAVKLWAEGDCSITANQSGGSGYAPAISVTQNFHVAGASIVLFLSGYQADGTTIEKGGYGRYAGSDLDGWWCATDWCGSGGSFSPTVGAENSSFYFYYNTPSAPAVGEYMGINLYAPGVTGMESNTATSGVQVTNQTHMKFNLAQNTEWFSLGATEINNGGNANINITLVLGGLFTTSGGACNIELLSVLTPTAADTTAYSVPLSSFTVSKACDQTSLTTASALAASPISQIKFDAAKGNKSVQNATTTLYPNQLTLTGAITFQ